MTFTKTQQQNVASQVKAVLPGQGRTGELLPGVGVVFKIDGQDTGEALSIVEHPFEVGAFVPPHIHTEEDEFSIVLEGEIGFRSEDEEVVLGPGGYIVKPRNEVHAMWNAGDEPARMIEVISPAGFERYFGELADLVAAGVDDIEDDRVDALSERYGVADAQPAWFEDVMARYDLSPPPS